MRTPDRSILSKADDADLHDAVATDARSGGLQVEHRQGAFKVQQHVPKLRKKKPPAFAEGFQSCPRSR